MLTDLTLVSSPTLAFSVPSILFVTMTKSDDPTSAFASGQADPVWPADKPLGLRLNSFVPTRQGHPPQGTVPDDILPEDVKRPALFEPLTLPHSKLMLKNRICVSPMCQYSSNDGFITPYHLAHLGSFALHGAGTIIVEASGVTPQGRITPQDVGIWKDEQIESHASLVSALKSFTAGLTVGVQLAHAGRKASTWSPFHRGPRKEQHFVTNEEGGWVEDVIAPSALPHSDGWIVPHECTTQEVQEVIQSFVEGARRAFKAGYDSVEIHSAHGYYLHSFLSPLSNKRTDQYGGSFENRTRALKEIVSKIKDEFPNKSVWVRVSSTDFAENAGKGESWTLEGTKRLAQDLAKQGGVDLIDCSGGGLVSFQEIHPKPGYQRDFAAGVSSLQIPKSQLTVGAVGILEGPDAPGELAEDVLQSGDADLIFLARGFLAMPHWPEQAGAELMGMRPAGNPQYHRVHPHKNTKPVSQPAKPQNNN